MGAWGAGVFENDDACDYAGEVAKDKNLKRLEATLARVSELGEDYLEAPDGSEALAAADIVGRLLGHWGQRDAYTAAVDAWVERMGMKPDGELIAKAQTAVRRVMSEPSELLELWSEGDPTEFKQAVDELSARLAG